MDIDDAKALFCERVGREPTPSEVAKLEEGIRLGRDLRRVVAGFMAMDYHRAQRGPEAMSLIRAERRGTPRYSDSELVRQKLHSAVDAIVDYLESTRAGR